MASHCELLAQQGRDSRPIGAIGVMATARRGTFCRAACFRNESVRYPRPRVRQSLSW